MTDTNPFAEIKTDSQGRKYIVTKIDATKEELDIFRLGFSLALEMVNNTPQPMLKPMIGGF